MVLAIVDTAGNLYLYTNVLDRRWTTIDGYAHLYFKMLVKDPIDGGIKPVRAMFPKNLIKTIRVEDDTIW